MRTHNALALDQLLRMFEAPDSLFMIGAGASDPIVPMAARLGELALERVLTIGHFPVAPVALDSVSENIIGQAKSKLRQKADFDEPRSLRAELSERVSPGAIQAAAIALLRPDPPEHCPQYEVFNLSRFPATLMNFNNDGLADAFCNGHVVLNVHGTSLSRARREELDWERWTNALQMFPTLTPPVVPGLLLPQVEPAGLIDTEAYGKAAKQMYRARRIALIGYSFGSMVDQVAYGLLTHRVAHTPAPVIIVGPDVGDLSQRIRDDARCVHVLGVKAFWLALADAIIASSIRRFHKSCDTSRLCVRCTSYAYEAILDGSRHVRSTRLGLPR